MGLDEAIEKVSKEQSVLKDVPIIKWLFIANDVRTMIQSAFFIRKYANFKGPINETMKDDLVNDAKLLKIFSDERVFSNIVDQTIISLDRYQTIQKAKMLGILFVETFRNNKFTLDEYNTLIFCIEFIHPSIGVKCLKSFYDYKCEMNKEDNEKTKNEI
jgi:hypothetical protein